MFKKEIHNNTDVEFFLNISNYFSFKAPKLNYLYHFNSSFNGYENVSLDNTFSAMSGALPAMLRIALNLGFSDITLVGCDYTHNPGLGLHFFEYGGGREIVMDTPFIQEYLESATQFADINTVTIDDNSTGHYLSGISYKKFTSNDPMYKENTSIVDMARLSQLNKCGMQYGIFPVR